MGLLNKTRGVVIGPMQFANGRGIREYFKNELEKLGIILFDHYNRPFIDNLKEDEANREYFQKLLDDGRYDELAKFKSIRTQDLAIIDKSDIIIFHYVPGVVTVGGYEELFWANRLKRVIFFLVEGKKSQVPFWIYWTIPHKYIYEFKEDVVGVLNKIDSGEKKIDSDRWRLLKPEFR